MELLLVWYFFSCFVGGGGGEGDVLFVERGCCVMGMRRQASWHDHNRTTQVQTKLP